jgi:hypothetical protein
MGLKESKSDLSDVKLKEKTRNSSASEKTLYSADILVELSLSERWKNNIAAD